MFSTPSLSKYIVVQPKWMYQTIVGRLLSKPPLRPPHVLYDDNGCAPLAEVERILTTDGIPGSFTVDMAHERGLLIKRPKFGDVVVPAKLLATRPSNVWLAFLEALSSGFITAGRRLVCTGSAGLSSAFFPLLQACLHGIFQEDPHNIEIPLWNGGLFVALSTKGAAQGFIQATPELRAIDVVVQGSEDNCDGVSDLLRLLVGKVLDFADQLSPGSGLKKMCLSSRQLAKLPSESVTDTSSCRAYSLESVHTALLSGGYVSDGGAFPEKVEGMLLSADEARGKSRYIHCLDCHSLSCLYCNSLSCWRNLLTHYLSLVLLDSKNLVGIAELETSTDLIWTL